MVWKPPPVVDWEVSKCYCYFGRLRLNRLPFIFILFRGGFVLNLFVEAAKQLFALLLNDFWAISWEKGFDPIM